MSKTTTWALVLALPLATTALPRQALNAETPAASAIRTAEAHFKRGVELYNEGNAEAALIEFRRAYDLAPRFQILYNLGQVAYALNDYAGAVEYFERYLAAGGDKLPEERRNTVEDDIRRLRGRVGRISVTCNVVGAAVAIDDAPLGRTPLPALPVNIGRRKVTIAYENGVSQVRVVDVAASETARAHFVLAPSARRSAGDSSPPAATESTRTTGQGLSSGALVAWAATGGLALGGLVFGALAWRESRDLDRLKENYPLTSSETLREGESSVSRTALAADALLGATALTAAVALWLTFSSPAAESGPPRAQLLPAAAPSGAGLAAKGWF